MSEKEGQKSDWIYLPEDVQEISLWCSLHDGELISCRSNLLERFVTLEIQVDHLVKDKENPTSFFLKLDNVTSVRASGHFRWVGKFEERENISNEERGILIQEYWAKWREESFSWTEFETTLATDPLDIRDASYVNYSDETALRLGGFLNGEKFDDIYFDVFLRGKTLTASRSDGEDFSLQSFIDLGEKYWDAFGS